MFSKTLKTILVALIFISSTTAISQIKKVSQSWTSFTQSIKVKTSKKTKFKLQASVRVDLEGKNGMAGLWMRVDNTNGESGFFDNMMDRPITSNQWSIYTIEGEMDEHAKTLNFGGICVYNGKFYFDDFELSIQNEKGEYEKVIIDNARFENQVKGERIPGWRRGIGKNKEVFVKEFNVYSKKTTNDNSFSLMFEGKDIKNGAIINTEEGYTPQIGTLVAMLNNLSKRVESAVQNLDVRETDHLLDEKANRIGALVMHLAAAEAYYQVFTFENRGFNEEEKEKWQLGLDLGKEAREKFKGKPIEYYLDIYKEVRKKTLEELAKRNDEWLKESSPSGRSNHHFNWFHVMEHQSSHLGQILMLKRRIPKEENNIKLPEEKVDQ
ncbi:DUF664 domain-containing protein [Aquimarina algiphila]|uniref:mycothiol transferase n=1 Tax=Aquimarina algiphila TaxID=2047982 RepID=UPI002492DF34|nr:DUF664 domain-containing protein [Aquimarina algiphila]